jgi:hypothetical protein
VAFAGGVPCAQALVEAAASANAPSVTSFQVFILLPPRLRQPLHSGPAKGDYVPLQLEFKLPLVLSLQRKGEALGMSCSGTKEALVLD